MLLCPAGAAVIVALQILALTQVGVKLPPPRTALCIAVLRGCTQYQLLTRASGFEGRFHRDRQGRYQRAAALSGKANLRLAKGPQRLHEQRGASKPPA